MANDNCLICWPNQTSSTTLSGGSWTGSLPLDNLKDAFLSHPARSDNTLESSTQFAIDFSVPTYTRILALIQHNMSADATIQVQYWADVTERQLVYDTGVVAVWPAIFEWDQLEWEDDNFWTCTLSQNDLANFPRIYLLVLEERQIAAHVTVKIHDTANPDGHIDIGGMFMSLDWQPIINVSFGAALGWSDSSEARVAWDGGEHFIKKSKTRYITGSLEFMEDAEAINKALLMTADRGITEDVFFVWKPSDVGFLIQRSFLGRLSSLSPIKATDPGIYAMDIAIKERR